MYKRQLATHLQIGLKFDLANAAVWSVLKSPAIAVLVEQLRLTFDPRPHIVMVHIGKAAAARRARQWLEI